LSQPWGLKARETEIKMGNEKQEEEMETNSLVLLIHWKRTLLGFVVMFYE